MSRQSRWLAEWRQSAEKPVFYHLISRVVERRFAFGPEEKEKFRTLMRMQEKFTGCRVVSYCLMCNHFHLLLEVPPMAEGGISDETLLKRLMAIYSDEFVAAIHLRFSYRMHDLSEFMKGLLQRFTQWFNRVHSRTGRLWEDRFKSLIVEDGVAAKTICGYIDLNPVRAGMVKDPADYRWSSYGEAIGGGAKGNGKTARAGLVRALRAHQGVVADADLWASGVSREYRKLLMAGAVGKSSESMGKDESLITHVLRKGMSKQEAEREREKDGEVSLGKMLRCRIRYFTDGAVIGSRSFVNEAFAKSRQRFGATRKDGARKMKGEAGAASASIWSLWDLRKGLSL